MNFFCARALQAPHDFFAGGAAYDGIVHKHNPLSLNTRRQRGEFECDGAVPLCLRRINKASAYVAVFYKPCRQRYPAFRAVPDCGVQPGIRYSANNIGVYRMFLSQDPAHIHP
jgi:hypothetical protein